MKLMDEKGRLFGKLNIVDLLVILLVVAVGAVLAVKLLAPSDDGGGADTRKLTYTVRVMEVTRDTYENVCQFVDAAAGKKDQLMASGQLLDGYVVDVSATDHIPTASDVVGGETLDLVFTVEANITELIANKVGTQEVRIGKSHILKTVHLEFEKSTILTCHWEE